MQSGASDFDALRRRIFYPKTDLMMGVDDLHAFLHSKPERTAAFLEIIPSLFEGDNLDATPLAGGTFHDVYLLKNDQDLILRIFAGPKPDETLSIDHHLSNLLHDIGIPSVQSHIYGSGDFDYQVTDFATGATLKDYKGKPEWHDLLAKTGDTFARLHGIATQGYGLLSAEALEGDTLHGLHETWAEYINLNLADHIAFCLKEGDISDAEAQTITSLFQNWTMPSFEPALLHGDPGPHNIFTDGLEITALIDWEDALSGDPLYEVAFWATFHPDADYEAFLNGYYAGADRPADFDKNFWMYYLRVSLAKTVHRHLFKYTDAPGALRASTRIQKALERMP